MLKPPVLQRKLSRKDSKKLKRSGSRREPLIQLDENGNPIHFPKEGGSKMERSGSNHTGTANKLSASKHTGNATLNVTGRLDRSSSKHTNKSSMLERIPSKVHSSNEMARNLSTRSQQDSVKRTKSKKLVDTDYSSSDALNVSRTRSARSQRSQRSVRSRKKNDDNVPLAISIAKSRDDENVPLAILQRTDSDLEPKRSKARRSAPKSKRESSGESVDIPFNY
jgi:hypothetical protein